MADEDVANGVVKADLQMEGFAALVTPAGAWQPGTIPANALVLVPISKGLPDELRDQLKQGAVLVGADKMWGFLGFNGQPVQVFDKDGRPIAIGVEDLLNGLKQHFEQNKKDLNAGRLYAQELMKHNRAEDAEKVLARVVAAGGGGQDWLALGVAQLGSNQLDKAESTLRGAQTLLTTNPYPSLNLAKVYQGKKDLDGERQAVLRAIEIDPKCIDAWGYLFGMVRTRESEDAAVKFVSELADQEPNKAAAAPYVALQAIYSADEKDIDKALPYAKKALERDENDVAALLSLSALLGQKRELQAAISLLSKHENKMMNNVALANNYLNALLHTGQLDRATKLLNVLSGSQKADVKRFAQASSAALAREFQRKQEALRQNVGKA